ncbi:DUF5329 family protein [Variovorax sp. PAMC 28711]|uniref:DUF5329 family protein n=1 Tax=Variovorax sp. PAMC 28711 TaxID=1795631 RepID=UPI00078C3748|nr:DUF5329 family protein [Variovorax sp. PAMC 28711]AMM24002.1 hypothetical protein AX767_06300 [Variovorax sp. PAMC 28711]
MLSFRFVQTLWLVLCLGLASVTSVAHATPPPDEQKLIAALIQRVETMSSMKFMRNGMTYSAADAGKHMRAKYDYFKDKIGTAEEFIARCASRSEMTGMPYRIQTNDGKEYDANAFLTQELRKVRGAPSSG